MLLFVAVPDRSTARKICPASPPGLIAAPNNRLPPRLTVVTWSKDGVTFGSFALLERTHQNPLPESPEQCKGRSEEHTSELQSQFHLVCRLLLEKKKKSQYE